MERYLKWIYQVIQYYDYLSQVYIELLKTQGFPPVDRVYVGNFKCDIGRNKNDQ